MFELIPYVLGSVSSLLLHEAGHLLAALAFGVKVRKVGITLHGPYIVREPGPAIANAIISAAGPGVNLAVAVFVWHSWPMLGIINLVLGIANLVPTPSSDGRRAWRAFMQARAESVIRTGVQTQRASSAYSD